VGVSGSVLSVSGVKLTEKVGGTMIGEVISTCSIFSDTPSEGSVRSSDIFIRENLGGPRKVSSMFMIYLVYGVIGVYTTRLVLYNQSFIYCTCIGAVG
jgi:hypothetical protein